MPKGEILDWVSGLAKNGISILLLLAGWMLFRLVTSIRQNPVGV
jgi:hypothetical protein